jgi:peptidoglycan hydrolase CwlO-like protein
VSGAIQGALVSAVAMLVLWMIERWFSKKDERQQKFISLEKRMSDAESDLMDLRQDLNDIRQKLVTLDENQTEIKEELSSRFSEIRQEYVSVKNDVKWIRRFLDKEDND